MVTVAGREYQVWPAAGFPYCANVPLFGNSATITFRPPHLHLYQLTEIAGEAGCDRYYGVKLAGWVN